MCEAKFLQYLEQFVHVPMEPKNLLWDGSVLIAKQVVAVVSMLV